MSKVSKVSVKKLTKLCVSVQTHRKFKVWCSKKGLKMSSVLNEIIEEKIKK